MAHFILSSPFFTATTFITIKLSFISLFI